MKENREYRYIPFVARQTEDGQTVVEGTVIRYGDVADIGGWFTEEFRAGWVENASAHDVREPDAQPRPAAGSLTTRAYSSPDSQGLHRANDRRSHNAQRLPMA